MGAGLSDLGIKRFLGVQTIFLAAFSQLATGPILWTFWVTLLGVNHPVADTLGSPVVWGFVMLCLLTEALSVVLGFFALRRPEHRHLIPFIPSMMLYFTLGTLAA